MALFGAERSSTAKKQSCGSSGGQAPGQGGCGKSAESGFRQLSQVLEALERELELVLDSSQQGLEQQGLEQGLEQGLG